MSTRRRVPIIRRARLILALTGATVATVILWPVLGGGYLLHADAVSTPRSFVTDTALGLADSAPRAVPQDWLVAVASGLVDGGWVVAGITWVAIALGAMGFGCLAARVLPAAGTPGAVAAAVLSMWNPLIAERLLQGQWSLLAGYAALGWLGVISLDLRSGEARWSSWVSLAGWLAAAGLTPTGSVVGLIVVVALLVVPTTADGRRGTGLTAVGIWVVSAMPWMLAAALGGAPATSDPGAVSAFAIRAEPALGAVGAALGLGGIWNAGSVPASRTGAWAAVATACLLLLVVAGSTVLWRRRRIPAVRACAVVAVVTLVVVVVAATPPGLSVLRWVIDTIPGAGLFRDTQKWLGLVLPLYALAAAAGVQWLGRWVPRGAALVPALMLIVLPLPDLAWGVGGQLRPVHYPADWARVAATVPDDSGDVAVLPSGSNRRYAFTDRRVSLDPAPRLLRADVVATGELSVDGRVVDAATGRARRVVDALRGGAPPAVLAREGVGWVLVETDQSPVTAPMRRTLAQATPVLRSNDLALYRLSGPADHRAGTAARTAMWVAHLVWLALLAAGVVGTCRRTPSPRRRSESAITDAA
ncbi:hypothetical protein [Williamsia sterculiae]|uniref:Transmembrane protein n=1 Tax=Williamsia sterculiae TaxID=1344003 RepID=A0A1N7CDY6_9NOCA|nr:hypothetical protein [Williamsia sterculiae]SIR61828.1 hypothetical protein SAMN05445060_0068 [Williamsia sterculiae]